MLCRNAVVDKARDKYIYSCYYYKNFTNNKKKWLLVGWNLFSISVISENINDFVKLLLLSQEEAVSYLVS